MSISYLRSKLALSAGAAACSSLLLAVGAAGCSEDDPTPAAVVPIGGAAGEPGEAGAVGAVESSAAGATVSQQSSAVAGGAAGAAVVTPNMAGVTPNAADNEATTEGVSSGINQAGTGGATSGVNMTTPSAGGGAGGQLTAEDPLPTTGGTANDVVESDAMLPDATDGGAPAMVASGSMAGLRHQTPGEPAPTQLEPEAQPKKRPNQNQRRCLTHKGVAPSIPLSETAGGKCVFV